MQRLGTACLGVPLAGARVGLRAGLGSVLDCQCHTFDDVEIALCRVIPGMTRDKAHQHAWEIHTTGASVVARAPKERAELYQEQLAARGLRVTIEPD